MYEIFEYLIAKNGTSSYAVSKATGVSQATLSEWKSGHSQPRKTTLKKIADYFNVSVEYLLNGGTPVQVPMEELTVEELYVIKRYREISPELREAIDRIVKE